MNGLSLLVLPSSRNRTRSEFAAASFMYSTILSHRASLLSAPTRYPRNCSGACSPAAVATSVDASATAAQTSGRRGLIEASEVVQKTDPEASHANRRRATADHASTTRPLPSHCRFLPVFFSFVSVSAGSRKKRGDPSAAAEHLTSRWHRIEYHASHPK